MSNAMLIDLTRCIGCRACQVSCKQANLMPAEETEFFGAPGGYQNPPALSGKTMTLVEFHEIEKPGGELQWKFAKRQCMHCEKPSCASACLVGALTKTPEGPVVYDRDKCIGCRYCMLACPFNVPKFEWWEVIPYIRKCTMCHDRTSNPETCDELNGKPLGGAAKQRINAGAALPACAKACPSGAITYGKRDQLLATAKARLKDKKKNYVPHIYGEKEVGGTCFLYISDVPFAELGFKTDLGDRDYPSYIDVPMKSVPYVAVGAGALLTGVYWWMGRRDRVAAADGGGEE